MGPMPSAALRPRTKNLITGTKVRAPYIYEGARTHAHGMTKGPLGVADSFVLLLLFAVFFLVCMPGQDAAPGTVNEIKEKKLKAMGTGSMFEEAVVGPSTVRAGTFAPFALFWW